MEQVRDLAVGERREIVLIPSDRARALERVTRRLGHDLRNPIGAILHFTEDLAADAGPGSPLAEDVGFIEMAVKEALGHLNELRSLVYREPADPSDVAVDEVAAAVVATAQSSAADGVTITLDAADELPTVRADRESIELVLRNVLANAVDAVQGAGTVAITVSKANGGVEILTTDDGRGMDLESINRSIEPFFTTASDSRSHGTGLSLAGGVVTGLEGRLAITSAPGDGTTVRVTLPVGTRRFE